MKVGFAGLGIMGAPMAANLIKAGFTLGVYNRTASRCEPLTELGATAYPTPAALAALAAQRDHAKARGATIYAELCGFGMSGDAHHITAPPEDGNGAARCMEAAIKDAGVDAPEVDYVNAHGTSTPLGDVAETRALKSTFGDHANKLAVSSTKSTTGHLLGAAGAVEAVFCVMALHDQVIPPTINLESPGEECDLDYVPNTARDAELNVVISNSFGFGGTNGSLLFKRFT